MLIPEHIIDEIRLQCDIIQIVSEYVALKKRGTSYVARCPFHNEKTPSFNVHPVRQVFKCFGCGVGGNIFTFLMNIEKISFIEAIRIAAQKCNITIPETDTIQNSETNHERERLLQIHEWAAEFFEIQLREDSETGKVQEYISSRGIREETCRKLRIGYAPDRWDALSLYLKQCGASANEIIQSGLVTLRESASGGYYDRFRNRIMFPIFDVRDKIIAFGGRVLGNTEPKYLNSPETPIYTKGNNLYGLHLSKNAIKKAGFVILVEGYLDFLIPFQEGISNIVASLGTALTDNQVRLVRRFLDKPQVIINFDSDSAGQNATQRSLELFLDYGFKINVLTLPPGNDPDLYIKTYGATTYRNQLKQSSPFIEYLVEQASHKFDISRPQEKVAAVNFVLPYIARIKEPIERALYAERLADRLKLDDKLVRNELKKAASGKKMEVSNISFDSSPDLITTVERRLLTAMLSDFELRAWCIKYMDFELVKNLESANLFEAIRQLHERKNNFDYDSLKAILISLEQEEKSLSNDEEKSSNTKLSNLIAELFLNAEPPDIDTHQIIYEQMEADITALRRLNLEQMLPSLQREIDQAKRNGDSILAVECAMRKLDIRRQLDKHFQLK